MTSEHFKGEDLETRVRQLEEAMSQLKGDSRLSNLPYGTLKEAASMLSIRSVGGTGGAYPAGVQNAVVATITWPLSANYIRAVPFYLPKPITASTIGIRVTAAVAGNAHIGIYEDKGEAKLYPHKLLLDAGTVNTGTTGVKSLAIKQSLPRGLVWLVLLSSSAATLTAFNAEAPGVGVWTPLGWSETGAYRYSFVYVSHAYGALPDPFPAGGTEGYDYFPYIFLKFG